MHRSMARSSHAEVGTGDIEAALAEYSRRWLPSALAVVELTEEGFGGNRRAFTLNLKLVQVRWCMAFSFCLWSWGRVWRQPPCFC